MDTTARSTQQNTNDPARGYAKDYGLTISGLSGVTAIDRAFRKRKTCFGKEYLGSIKKILR